MFWRIVILGLGLFAFKAPAQSLVIRGAPASVRLMGRTGALTVERLDVNGTPVTGGNLQVIFAAPAGAQVALAPEPFATWASMVTAMVSPGSSVSAPVYVRSGVRGLQSWTASGPGFVSAIASIFVRDDALTCDVETGTTLDTAVPHGCFNTAITPYPQSTMAASASAAHRGNFGLRLIDGEAGTGNAADTSLFDDGAPLFGEFHARTWVRIVSTNQLGQPIIAQVSNGTGIAPSLVDVKVRSNLDLLLGGFESDAGYSEAAADAGLQVGVWHLLQLSLTGVGSADGGRSLWLDGVEVAQQRVDFSGTRLPVGRLALGEPYADDRRWLGTIDFDDVRTAGVPLATGFSVRLPGDGGFVGECLPLEVSLRARFGGRPATTGEALQVTLDAGALGELFEDSACALQVASGVMPAGTSSVTLSFRASAPAPSVLATHPDFLPGSSTLDVIAPPALVLAPSFTVAAPGAVVNFTVTGGTGRGLFFELLTNSSGGNIDATGRYQAGATSGNDVVRLRDSAGQTTQAAVQVVADAGMTLDAGTLEEARSLSVGCGCEGGGGALLFPLLLAWRRRGLGRLRRR